MTEMKKTAVQQFDEKLAACNNKDALLLLARDSIRISDSQCGLDERRLPRQKAILDLALRIVELGRLKGKINTNGKLALIMKKYGDLKLGSPEHFHSDFKKTFPEEYQQIGAEKRKERMRAKLKTESQTALQKPTVNAPQTATPRKPNLQMMARSRSALYQ